MNFIVVFKEYLFVYYILDQTLKFWKHWFLGEVRFGVHAHENLPEQGRRELTSNPNLIR